MIITFITVFAWIVFLGFIGWAGLVAYVFSNLAPWEKRNAEINISGITVVVWLASLAWIIARFVN